MSQLPYRSCPIPGCPEYSRGGGRCEKHSLQQKKVYREKTDARRGTTKEQGYAGAWRRVRRSQLKKYPLCERCLKRGITKAADMVHHIVAIKDGGSKTAWSNLESLCNECHEKEHRRFNK